jgi:Ca2+-binding EF-hand superfamily protein
MKRTTMIGAALAALLATTAGVTLAQTAAETAPPAPEAAAPADDMPGRGPMAMFAEMDANGDGSVTVEEVDAFRTARFAALDADGNGTVSRQEFMDQAAARAAERAGTMFDRLDADGDGTLTRDVIEARRGPGPDAEMLIERFDTDGDGAVSEEEIAVVQERMMERHEGRGDRMGHGGGRHGGGRDGGWFGWHRDG